MVLSGIATEWTACKQEKGHLVLCPKKLGKESLPDVIGMTPRDAVYILELYGLKVKLVGKGRVSSQSLPAGSKAQKGNQITLTLTNA
jgi:cell division protein FtsI (penicillin-binding protein 3)